MSVLFRSSRCPETCVRVLGVLTIAACGRDAPADARAFSARDSSGVQIVELVVDTTSSPRLSLADAPTRLGAGNDAVEWHRVVDAQLLADGGTAVANAGSKEILIFDASGRLIGRLGGHGSGPGEFMDLAWLDAMADSIVAGDRRLRRITVFDAGGEVARVESLAGTSLDQAASGNFAPQPLGMFGDGSVVIASYSAHEPVPGPTRPPLSLFRSRRDDQSRQLLGSWPGDELHLLAVEDRLHVLTPVFARSTVVRISPERLIVGDSEHDEIHVLAPDGERSVVRWSGLAREATDDMRNAVIRERFHDLQGAALQQRIAEQERMSLHQTLPAFGSLLIDPDGRIWFSPFARPDDSTSVWIRVDRQIGHIQILRLPSDLQLLDVGRRAIVALARDELGTEDVRVYRIVED